jgi:hypothetical protein
MVDTGKFCLRVARREPMEGEGKNTNKWVYYNRAIPLPEEVLDVTARKVPDGFKIRYLPPDRDAGPAGSPKKNFETMEVTPSDEGENSER